MRRECKRGMEQKKHFLNTGTHFFIYGARIYAHLYMCLLHRLYANIDALIYTHIDVCIKATIDATVFSQFCSEYRCQYTRRIRQAHNHVYRCTRKLYKDNHTFRCSRRFRVCGCLLLLWLLLLIEVQPQQKNKRICLAT